MGTTLELIREAVALRKPMVLKQLKRSIEWNRMNGVTPEETKKTLELIDNSIKLAYDKGVKEMLLKFKS